ncbi:MAG: preprotein translocase subunit YajC [Myxococcota bacterium]|nr:preprotein translocase subunit YajC [Myxococcota bacterium]
MKESVWAVPLQAEGPGAGFDPSFFLMMAAIFAIFYFLVIRPQQRQQKEREAAIKALVRGDKVITTGGLHGVVSDVSEDLVKLEIARVKGGLKVEVEVARSGIGVVTKAAEAGGGESS